MDLKNILCLGVAGNFAHHLEQAGELKDFEDVVTKEKMHLRAFSLFICPIQTLF